MSSPSEPPKDYRRAATSAIWGCATGMLAICLSLTNQPFQGNRGTVISIAILAGATISTVTIWRSSKYSAPETSRQVRALQERITNLEMIVSSSEVDWRPPLSHLEQTPTQAADRQQ